MTTIVKRRGGTTREHKNFIGAAREVTVDTDKKTLVVHDGITPGGFPLAREDFNNVRRACLFWGFYEEDGQLKVDTDEGDFVASEYPVWFLSNSDVSFSINDSGHLIIEI